MIIKHGKIKASSAIFAAGEDDFENDGFDDTVDDMDEEGFNDTLDDIADDIDDLQDDLDDVEEDEVSIDVDNNISGHYIAECEKCHGIFISAMVQSDQTVESIRGTCPICDKDSEQFLKWVITPVE